MKVNDWFRQFARRTAEVVGSAWTFAFAVVTTLLWVAIGPYYNYSDTWQLVANTFTTVVTYLIVFIIQNTQNTDAKAMHLKLGELIKSTDAARNEVADAESMSEDDIKAYEKKNRRHKGAKQASRAGG